MSVSNYEEFLENPLKLDERLPTIEEVLLVMDTFLLRKADLTDNDENDKDSFRNVRNRLNEVKKGNNNIDKRDIFLWFKFFGLDKTQTNTFIEKYVKYLKAPMVRGSDKNFYIQRISNYKDELCDSSKDFVNYLKNGYKLRNVFNKKYSDEEKINKNIVRDFISLYINKDYANMKKNLKFYEQFVREIDSIKYEDVITAIKSAYLTKGKELEEIEKVNKIWDERNRKDREKFLG